MTSRCRVRIFSGRKGRPWRIESTSSFPRSTAILVRKGGGSTTSVPTRRRRAGRKAEMDEMFNVQVALRRRSEELGRGLKEMLDEKEDLEQQLQMVLMNSDVLEAWLSENEGKTKDGVDVDEAFQCVDAFSKQMLECTVADLAIEDVMYSLDKAVQDGGERWEVKAGEEESEGEV